MIVVALGTLGHFVKRKSTNANQIHVSTEYAATNLDDMSVNVTSCILASTAMYGLTLVLPFLVNTMASVYWMTKDSTVTAPEPVTPEADVSRKRTSATQIRVKMVALASMTSTVLVVTALGLASLVMFVIDPPHAKIQVRTLIE